MSEWFRSKSQRIPSAVARASELEHGIRDDLALDEAEAAYRELQELARTEPEYADIRRLQANAALNLLRKRPEPLTDADRALLAEIQALVDTHPEEGILRECLVHLAWEFMSKVPADAIEESAALHARQMRLYDRHEDVRTHAEPVVLSTMKLMTDHLINGNIEAARKLYADIVSLAQRHPDDGSVQYARCGSAHNLISRLVTLDDMGEAEMSLARDYFAELKTFVETSPFQADLADILDEVAALFD